MIPFNAAMNRMRTFLRGAQANTPVLSGTVYALPMDPLTVPDGRTELFVNGVPVEGAARHYGQLIAALVRAGGPVSVADLRYSVFLHLPDDEAAQTVARWVARVDDLLRDASGDGQGWLGIDGDVVQLRTPVTFQVKVHADVDLEVRTATRLARLLRQVPEHMQVDPDALTDDDLAYLTAALADRRLSREYGEVMDGFCKRYWNDPLWMTELAVRLAQRR